MTDAIMTAVYPSSRNQKIVHTTVTLRAFDETLPTMRIIAIAIMTIERQSMARIPSFWDRGIIEEPRIAIGMLITAVKSIREDGRFVVGILKISETMSRAANKQLMTTVRTRVSLFVLKVGWHLTCSY